MDLQLRLLSCPRRFSTGGSHNHITISLLNLGRKEKGTPISVPSQAVIHLSRPRVIREREVRRRDA